MPLGLILVEEGEAASPGFGTLMICPAHAHGTLDEAEKILKNRLREKPAGRPSSVVLCRANQVETLKRFAPLVDRVVLNPFALQERKGPEAGEVIWPGSDHPLLNQVRNLHRHAGAKPLLALVDVRGESSLFGDRRATFEEVKWESLAVLGANYRGLVWRGLDGCAFASRVRALEATLRERASEMDAAAPVAWVSAEDRDQPVAALVAGRRLFIVLLDRDYMKPSVARADKEVYMLPLEPARRLVGVQVRPPDGVTVTTASTLSGRPVHVEGAGAVIRVNCRVEGGGELLICDLSGTVAGTRQRPQTKPSGEGGQGEQRP
jgi:hypothetical protein